MNFHHPGDHPILQSHFFDVKEVDYPNGDDDSIGLCVDGPTMHTLKGKNLCVADEIADLIRVSLAHCSSLSYHTKIIDKLLLFCKALTPSEYKDVEAIFEVIQLLCG